MIEYMVIGLSATHRLATLSRGYGRHTKGFRLAGPADTAQTIGDEPRQLYRKFGATDTRPVLICVGERRADALRQLERDQPQVDTVLLDDAYQHRAVQPALNLLLTDINRPFYADHPFPEGRLRESRYGARRADAVLVTKCPDDLPESERVRIAGCLRPYTRPDTPVFFTGLHYGLPISFATRQAVESLTDVVLVSGLANADSLERYVSQRFRLVRHERFADHYAYTRSDYERLQSSLPLDAALLTTEKDWVKLDALPTDVERTDSRFYYLPITVRFLADEAQFWTMVQRSASL